MRRLNILAPLLAGLLLVEGCTFPVNSPQKQDVYAPDEYLTEYQDNWQYQLLSSTLKDYYGSIYTAVVESLDKDMQVSYVEDEQQQEKPGLRITFPDAHMDYNEVVELYEAFYKDHPQFFFLDRSYRMEGVTDSDGQTYYDTLLLEYTLSAEDRVDKTRELKAAVDALMADCPADKDEYIREQYLHDKLAEICIYDVESTKHPIDESSSIYTAYGALVNGKAVCEGYAKAITLLLNETGIRNTTISGFAKDEKEPHMWNLVVINGEHYYLDATWNDANNRVEHTYFNLTTSMLNQTHRIEEGQPGIPECSATKDNYFARNGTYVDSYLRQDIAQAIANRVIAGDTVIQLRFQKEMYNNGLLFLKNRTQTLDLVNQLLLEEEMQLWDYSLTAIPEQQVLTLVKKEA